MIDVVGTISGMVDQWNYESKCGLCWAFSAPLRISDLNEWQARDDNECCVLVAVTDYSFECNKTFNRTTGFAGVTNIIHDFTLYFLSQDSLGKNVYDEIKGHPLSESKWSTILQPIMECVGCDALDFCAAIGQSIEVSRWRATTRLDWQDMNYSGWAISVQLRENNIG